MTIITHEGYSYEISSDEFAMPNEEHTIFECIGVKVDPHNNKELITMLFIKGEELTIQNIINQSNGLIEAVCQLPSTYSDDRLHKKYPNEIKNQDFWLCVKKKIETPKESSPITVVETSPSLPEKKNYLPVLKSIRKKLLYVDIAVIFAIIVFAIIALLK